MGRLGHAESALCVDTTGRRAPEPGQDSASGGCDGDGVNDARSTFPDRVWPTA